ncbi:MAG: hypothetical protein LPK85_06275, partial [Gammaproteobacteria bacterium]|nr:hypothetical protein [Gammaproteobacteria bacterium]
MGWLRGTLVVLLSLLAGWVQANTVVLNDQGQRALDSHVRYLEDSEHRLTVADLIGTPQHWRHNTRDAFNQGYNDSSWWLHLSLRNAGDDPQSRFLEIAYAVLDHVDVHLRYGDGRLVHHQLGDKLPYPRRLVDHPFFIIPIDWQPQETVDVYIRLRTSSAVQAPLTLWQKDIFQSHVTTANILQGFYYGALIIIAIYNLLLF